MTYEKALNYFKSRVDGKGIDTVALCFAMEALEKQIKKEVIGTGLIRFCPSCRQKFFVDDEKAAMQCYACPRCGQKLKWNSRKEEVSNMDLQEVMKDAQQAINGDYEQYS